MNKKRGFSLLVVIVFIFNVLPIKFISNVLNISTLVKAETLGNANYKKKNITKEEKEALNKFYKETASLVEETWSNNYFDNIKINVGENKTLANNKSAKESSSDTKVEIEEDNSLMLSVKEVLELTGGEVNLSNGKVIINNSGDVVELGIDKNNMVINDVDYSMKNNTKIINNNIMVSEEVFTKALGYSIDFNEEEKVVTVEKPFQTMRLIVKSKNNNIDLSKYNAIRTINSPDNIVVLQFDSISKTQLCYEELMQSKEIEYVEPDLYIELEKPVVEELEQYELNGTSLYKSWGVEHIEADKYSKYLGYKNLTNSVTVAVVDTGIDFEHPFLKGRILSNGYDFCYNDTKPLDDNGHGTHVSGIIVDATPKLNINILPIKVLNSKGSGSSLVVANGIEYAATNGADIINLSLGSNEHYKFLEDKIESTISSGVTVVIAAGNSNIDTVNVCPSHSKNAIVVSAIYSDNSKAWFSNYGDSIDVTAPGVDIISAYPGGGEAKMSGTSMAAPHISAVAAMFKLKNPNFTPLQIENLVKKNTKDIGSSGADIYFGSGVPKLSLDIIKVPVKSISLNKTNVELFKKESVDLTVNYNPIESEDNDNVKWTTSNSKVVSVENGKVIGMGPGTAIVKAEVEGQTATAIFVVKESRVINIPDKNLKRVLNKELGNDEMSEITISELESITWLNAGLERITNLEGLQYAKNIKHLSLRQNNISDLTIFEAGSNNLDDLDLSSNPIKDISVFAKGKFPSLRILDIGSCQISDISSLALADLPKLISFDLEGQYIMSGEQKVLSGGSLSVDNIATGIDGTKIDNINVDKGEYIKSEKKVRWENIVGNNELAYYFSSTQKIGSIDFKFSGLVKTPVIMDFEKEDVNKDNIIDIKDLEEIANRYNNKNGQSLWNENLDINKDNLIDIFDIVLVSKKIQVGNVLE